MNWDDLRYVVAVYKAGSLTKAAKQLKVDHTTVRRRIEALEAALGVPLFARTPSGYVATSELERLLPEVRAVEASVLALERSAFAQLDAIEGVVRVAAPETFGACYLAPRLALFSAEHPGLTIEVITGRSVLDLSRREADIALRFFRTSYENIVTKRAGTVTHGLYAARSYLAKHPVTNAAAGEPLDLRGHRVLTSFTEPGAVEAVWVTELLAGEPPAFVANFTVSLLEAARAGAGIAVLPHYLGDRESTLHHLPVGNEPQETLWLTVHRDVREASRVRAVLDFLTQSLRRDRALLLGAAG
jgi:DNA-binding transcriptional LysR family regulator